MREHQDDFEPFVEDEVPFEKYCKGFKYYLHTFSFAFQNCFYISLVISLCSSLHQNLNILTRFELNNTIVVLMLQKNLIFIFKGDLFTIKKWRSLQFLFKWFKYCISVVLFKILLYLFKKNKLIMKLLFFSSSCSNYNVCFLIFVKLKLCNYCYKILCQKNAQYISLAQKIFRRYFTVRYSSVVILYHQILLVIHFTLSWWYFNINRYSKIEQDLLVVRVHCWTKAILISLINNMRLAQCSSCTSLLTPCILKILSILYQGC